MVEFMDLFGSYLHQIVFRCVKVECWVGHIITEKSQQSHLCHRLDSPDILKGVYIILWPRLELC